MCSQWIMPKGLTDGIAECKMKTSKQDLGGKDRKKVIVAKLCFYISSTSTWVHEYIR